jgi:hypothetical protein
MLILLSQINLTLFRFALSLLKGVAPRFDRLPQTEKVARFFCAKN